MNAPRVSHRILLGLLLYLTFCSIAGVWLADVTLHPPRRPLTPEDETFMVDASHTLDADFADVSISTSDSITLRAWLIHPRHANGDSVILLHGLGDNRIGMTGYAQLLLTHGYSVLMPDARAHGASGGPLATYGLLERYDIHQWFDFLNTQPPDSTRSSEGHARCIFALGESMGAAQLLQSLDSSTPFCAVVAESSFATFHEIAFDRMGQPFHLGPWFGRVILRPLVEAAFLRARWKYNLDLQQVSPEDSVARTQVPVLLIHGQIDSNIPIRHSREIRARNPNAILWEVPHADHCGAISTAPQEFEQRVIAWFADHSSPPTAN
ncbi:MAG TPA: alpha/beta fold hydrolase [Candidatus Sulfotelmatobacter sp.]